MSKKKYSKQQICKLFQGDCFFCGETDYAVLDAHRIIEQGQYQPYNIVVMCSNCHRKTHDGQIKIDRKYMATCGQVLHFWQNDEEFWKPIKF